MIAGTDLARLMPATAARLVANPDADTRNAWDVLVSAFDEREATALVLLTPGGRAALVKLGIDVPPTAGFAPGDRVTDVRRDLARALLTDGDAGVRRWLRDNGAADVRAAVKLDPSRPLVAVAKVLLLSFAETDALTHRPVLHGRARAEWMGASIGVHASGVTALATPHEIQKATRAAAFAHPGLLVDRDGGRFLPVQHTHARVLWWNAALPTLVAALDGTVQS